MGDKNIFLCSWDEFEDWIRKRINGDLSSDVYLLFFGEGLSLP